MRVFVTGASGYLGQWVVHELSERGHRVVGVNSEGEVVYREEGAVGGFIAATCDAVVHLGWRARAGSDEPDAQERSLGYTVRLLERVGPSKRVIFASTAAVYGDTRDREVDETARPKPTCSYGFHKLSGEELVARGRDAAMSLRLGSLMGAGRTRETTKTDTCVNAFAAGGYSSEREVRVWGGESWKPVLHVRDAARILVHAVETPRWVGTVNAAESSYRASELATLAAMVTGGRVIEVEQQRGSRSCRLDCGKLRREMVGVQLRGVEEAVREFAGWERS